MSNEMTTQFQGTSGQLVDSGFMMSLSELKLRATMVSQIKRELMVDKVHFGAIPGCGDKPTLLKNGAELLCMAFRLASGTHADINDLGNGHREYTVTTTLTSGGELVATGIGSCSTMESKYRYRGSEMENTGKPVPKEYWNKKDPATLGGKGFTAKKDDNGRWMIFKKGDKKLENPDIADVYNTVLKMASKRSLIDAVLKATGGSCEFTQDLEDNLENGGNESSEFYGDSQQHFNAEPAQNMQAPMQEQPADRKTKFIEVCNKMNPPAVKEALRRFNREKLEELNENELDDFYREAKKIEADMLQEVNF